MKAANAIARMLGALAAVALLAGCGGGAGPNEGVAGDYSLILVNGDAVPPPVEVFDGNVTDETTNEVHRLTAEVIGGTLELDRVGSYQTTIRVNTAIDGEPHLQDYPIAEIGLYEIHGDVIRFDPDTLPAYEATLDGRRITVADSHPDFGTFTLTFEKPATQ